MVTEHIARLAPGEHFSVGQLRIERNGDRWFVAGPPADGHVETLAPDPDTIRRHVRFDPAGRYRPLSGARNLPAGWRIDCATPGDVLEVVETIYPLALRHADRHQRGDLCIIPLEDVLERQSGRYEIAAHLSPAGREAATGALCPTCIRTPLWHGDAPGDAIPCPEACSVLVALCREAAVWERDGTPTPVRPDRSTPFAAFEQPGNEVRESYLAARTTILEVS